MRYILLSSLAVISTLTLASAQVVSPGSGCTTCQANELAVVDIERVSKGRYAYTAKPTCQSDSKDDLKKIISSIGQAITKDYAGALSQLIQTDEFRNASSQVHGDVGKILNGGKTDQATCRLMCNFVPVGAEITGYSIAAGNDEKSFQKCEVGKDCPIGYSRFEGPFDSDPSDQASKTQCFNFLNWDSERDRSGRVVTFFIPPKNWVKSRDF